MTNPSLVLFLSLLSLPFVAGYAGIGVACQEFNITTSSSSSSNVVVGGNANTNYVCAIHQFYGPSPAVVDGVNVSIGEYEDEFTIFQLDDGINPEHLESLNFLNLSRTGETIHVLRHIQSRQCNVTVTGTPCTSCSVCDSSNDMKIISADCSNIQGGRYVNCEPIEKVFYPLQGYSRNQQQETPTTSAPDATCLARGASCITSQECCSDRCVLNVCQASNTDSQYQRTSLRSPGRGGAAGGATGGGAVDLSGKYP